MSRAQRVVLCDDEEMVLEAITLAATALGLDVVAATTDPEEAVELVAAQRPEVCLLDAHFPDRSGPETARRMQAAAPDTHVVMLTAAADEEVWAAYDQGHLHAVVNKSLDFDTLQRTVTALSRGERVVAGWRRRASSRTGPVVEPLTDREREVLAALVRGANTADIARELTISAHTVRSHVQSVMRKLRVTTRAKATHFAVANGLLEAS